MDKKEIIVKDEISSEDFGDLIIFLNNRYIKNSEKLLRVLNKYEFGQSAFDSYLIVLKSSEHNYILIRNGKEYRVNYNVFVSNSDLFEKQVYSSYGKCFEIKDEFSDESFEVFLDFVHCRIPSPPVQFLVDVYNISCFYGFGIFSNSLMNDEPLFNLAQLIKNQNSYNSTQKYEEIISQNIEKYIHIPQFAQICIPSLIRILMSIKIKFSSEQVSTFVNRLYEAHGDNLFCILNYLNCDYNPDFINSIIDTHFKNSNSLFMTSVSNIIHEQKECMRILQENNNRLELEKSDLFEKKSSLHKEHEIIQLLNSELKKEMTINLQIHEKLKNEFNQSQFKAKQDIDNLNARFIESENEKYKITQDNKELIECAKQHHVVLKNQPIRGQIYNNNNPYYYNNGNYLQAGGMLSIYDINEENKKIKKLQSENEKLKKENEKLTSTLSSLGNENSILKTIKDEYEHKKKCLTEENVKLKSTLSLYEKQQERNNDGIIRMERMEVNIEQMKSLIEAINKNKDRENQIIIKKNNLKEENLKLKSQIDILKNEKQKLHDEIIIMKNNQAVIKPEKKIIEVPHQSGDSTNKSKQFAPYVQQNVPDQHEVLIPISPLINRDQNAIRAIESNDISYFINHPQMLVIHEYHNDRFPIYEGTLLHIAVFHNRNDIVRFFINNENANLEATDGRLFF